MRKAVISASALALFAALPLVGTASQANAATTCYESSCTGLLAANTTCINDAEVIYSVDIPGGGGEIGNIQLKYSPSCRTTWARVITNLDYGSAAQILGPQGMESCGGAEEAPGTGCNTAMLNDAGTESTALGIAYENSSLTEYGDAQTPYF